MKRNTAKLKKIIKKINSLCERKSYPPTLLNYLYLVTYGMINTYGKHYCDLIYSTIEENEIILGIEALKKETSAYTKDCIAQGQEAFLFQEVTKKEPSCENQKQICIPYDFEKEPNINPIFILELMAHELNCILTNVENNLFYLEVINTLQTENIIKEILSLNIHKVKNKEIVSILESLSSLSPKTYASTRFANETALYRDLYNIPTYQEFINSNTLEGNRNAIINDFDETIGANAFDKFITLYDEYNAAFQKGEENHWQKEDIDEIATLAKQGRRFISLYKEKKYPCIKCA